MYQVYIDSTLVYDDEVPENNRLKLSDPTLDIDMTSAGTFKAKIPPTNVGYNIASPVTSTVEVYRDGAWMWTGRPLTVDEDFFGNRDLNCEGALSFFNDIIIEFRQWKTQQVTYIVGDILEAYNEKVSDSRKIYKGIIASTTEGGEVINTYSMVSDNNTALECLNNIIEYWGLYPRIRKTNGQLILDLITTTHFNLSTQRIDFGRNLLDFTKESNWSGIVTSIMPLGKTLDTHDESGDEEYPDRVNISSVNSGSKFLIRTADKNKYGLIQQKVEFNDVDDPTTLKKLAQVYLNELQFGDITINITVADLHYLDASIQGFSLYTQVNCYSEPHGLDKTFVVTKMSIPFDHPENTKFTFSSTASASMGSASRSIGSGRSMSNIAGHIPKITEFRKIARSNAAKLILSATNGFVSLVQSEDGSHVEYLSITNAENMDDATQRWIWTVNGLMHQKRKSKDDPWDNEETNIAITMDGEIVADVITTGVIRAGDNYINLDTGEVHLAYASYTDAATGETKDFVELAKSGKQIADEADKRSKENAEKAAEAAEAAQKAWDKQVGGANLLFGTDTMQSWIVAGKLSGTAYSTSGEETQVKDFDPWILYDAMNDKSRGYNYYSFEGFLGLPKTWDVVLMSPKDKLRVYDVKDRRLTLSFYTSCGVTGGMATPINDNNALFVCLALCDANGVRQLWRDVRINEAIKEEKRIKISFTMEKQYFNRGSYSGGISALYFQVRIFPRTDSNLTFNRFQLEFGDEATDWHAKHVDLQEHSEKLANSAYEAARVYTNAISEKDREFTEDQTKALQESLTQREILRRLTNNFTTKGIWLENNELYINGTYVRSGTLDAGIIKAGILTDEVQQNLWNMATGYFQTKNAVMENANVTGQFTTGDWEKIMLQDGQIVGYTDNRRVGYLDVAAHVYDLDDERSYNGIQIAGEALRISTKKISVLDQDNVGKTTTTAYNGTFKWDTVQKIQDAGSGSIRWETIGHGIKVINGLVVSIW